MGNLGEYFSKNKNNIVDMIDEGNSVRELPRPYLGMSQIGSNCKRSLWFYFRFSDYSRFDGRVKRIFQTGNDAEPKMIKDLESIGVECYDTLDQQAEFVAIEGYMKGHGDGMCRNIPGAEKTEHVLEFKTMSDKYFKQMVKQGVKDAKPVYYAQVVIYMYFTKTSRTLFMVINKNTSEYYVERVHADDNFARELLGIGRDIIYSEDFNEFPKIGSGLPSYYECKFCNFVDVCHHQAKPVKTCRTCTSCKLPGDGKFVCGITNKELSVEEQHNACANYNLLDCFLD